MKNPASILADADSADFADSEADPPEEEHTVENSAPGSRFLPLVDDPEYGDFSDEARAERRRRNLDAIREFDPVLAEQLEDYKPGAELVFDDDGSPNIKLGGKKLYERPVKEYNRLKHESFWIRPDRVMMSPIQPQGMDEYNSRPLHNMIKRIDDAGIPIYAAPETRRSHYIISLGIGLGLHFKRFVEETQCHYMACIEPNLEFLYHSLEVTDWAEIFETLNERGGRAYFIISRGVDEVDRTVRGLIRMNGPCAFDGVVFIMHYQLPLFASFAQTFSKKMALTLYGFGFTEDEFYMIRHTYANLSGGEARVSQRSTVAKQPCPLFLVASGPSLDAQIEVIRAHQDNAVIFTCGSAVRPLLAAGITPDMHLEIERNIEVLPLIQHPAGEFDFKPIMLVASSTVDPRMQAYFGRTVYYFRAALSSSPLFAVNGECQPAGCGPTVLNAALGFAQDVGFRNIYFFGADLGTKVQGVHHAAESWHNTPDGFEGQNPCETPTPGNFGGTVFSNRDLLWTREELESSIRRFNLGWSYYNCSDGQRIKGAKAVLPRTVSPPEISTPGGKKQVLDDLWETFPVYSREMLSSRWDHSLIMDEIDVYLDEIIAAVNDNPDLENRKYLNELQKIFLPEDNPRKMIWGHVFRGTMITMLIAVEFYLTRIRGRENFDRACEIAREELVNVAEAVRASAYEELAGLGAEGPLMKYVNRKDLTARSEKEIPEPLPVPKDLQKLFDEQPWAGELKALYAEQAEKKAAHKAGTDAPDSETERKSA